MPELKHTFQGGKMEKDKDERIVPNGQYREALNISVATSEDSDVGAAQNILGNVKVTESIAGRTVSGGKVGTEYSANNSNVHVAAITDPQTDMLYRFINTVSTKEGLWLDRIVEYDTTSKLSDHWTTKESAVFVDIYKVKAKITTSTLVCSNGNRSVITVNKNINQLRWGMKVVGSSLPSNLVIEDINYVTKKITLNQAIPTGPHADVAFYGDRNLNFSQNRSITGLNILDGMIFWTDNHSEPKKIEIKRSKLGSDTSLWTTTAGLVGRHSPGVPKIDDFNQHTVLIVDELVQYDLYTDESICPVQGCTNPLAYNYDPAATVDDGSCCTIPGCTDPNACNYDASVSACYDDGTCCYILGCTDPTYQEYDSDACCDDGSCLTPIRYACMYGYDTDDCDDTNEMVQVADSDMYNASNWFSELNSSNNFDIEFTIDSVLQWFSLNDSSSLITPRWFVTSYIGASWGSNSWYNDGDCNYEGSLGSTPFIIRKRHIQILKIKDLVVPNANIAPLVQGGIYDLGNPSGLGPMAGNSWEMDFRSSVFQGNVNPIDNSQYTQVCTIDDIVDFLRNESIFNGLWSYYDANYNVVPVPEITLGMDWATIKAISEGYYNFIPPSGAGGDGPVSTGEWIATMDTCNCGTFEPTPTCNLSENVSDSITGTLYLDSIQCANSCPGSGWTNPLVLSPPTAPPSTVTSNII